MRLYGSLTKIDTEQRIVAGYASTEAVDAHGEIVTKAAIEAALDDYLEWGNVREMHMLSAVGVTEEASIDEKGLYIAAKITDDIAWGKVTSGTYKGFSIGGRTLARDKDNKKIITKIALNEISLVDRPSNPEARFDVWKAAGLHNSGDLAKVIGERDQLAKQLAGLADRVERTMGAVAKIVAENTNYRKQNAELTKRLAALEQPHAVDNVAAAASPNVIAALAGLETLEAEIAKTAAGISTLQVRFQAPPRTEFH
jgi:HK97 family phage prohead protease